MNANNSFCGFECVFEKKSDVWTFLKLFNIVLDDYYFSVVDESVFSNRIRIEICKEFKVNYFEELIQKKFVSECLVLHLYPEGIQPEEINSYHDFLESTCEMIILLYDFVYLEIYCKNQIWLRNLMCEAISISGAVVEAKYENTDTRTIMYV